MWEIRTLCQYQESCAKWGPWNVVSASWSGFHDLTIPKKSHEPSPLVVVSCYDIDWVSEPLLYPKQSKEALRGPRSPWAQ